MSVIERFRNQVKPYRRVATRYDKLDTSDLAFAHLASALVVLRHPETAHTPSLSSGAVPGRAGRR